MDTVATFRTIASRYGRHLPNMVATLQHSSARESECIVRIAFHTDTVPCNGTGKSHGGNLLNLLGIIGYVRGIGSSNSDFGVSGFHMCKVESDAWCALRARAMLDLELVCGGGRVVSLSELL